MLVLTQRIVSKAEGAIVELTTITPRPEAVEYATKWGRDARQVEVVLQEAIRVVRMDRGVIITETSHGFVLANSGVDASNVGPRSGEIVTLLPLVLLLGTMIKADPGLFKGTLTLRPWYLRAALALCALGVAMELAQSIFTNYRMMDPWDGVADVRPFGAMENKIVEGVY